MEAAPRGGPQLAVRHAAELGLEKGRKLKPRPSRLDANTTRALNALVQLKASDRALTELAADIGLDYVGFWKMLKGKANPTIAQLHLIADYFQVDVDQVLGRRPVEGASYAALGRLLDEQKERIRNNEAVDRIHQCSDLR